MRRATSSHTAKALPDSAAVCKTSQARPAGQAAAPTEPRPTAHLCRAPQYAPRHPEDCGCGMQLEDMKVRVQSVIAGLDSAATIANSIFLKIIASDRTERQIVTGLIAASSAANSATSAGIVRSGCRKPFKQEHPERLEHPLATACYGSHCRRRCCAVPLRPLNNARHHRPTADIRQRRYQCSVRSSAGVLVFRIGSATGGSRAGHIGDADHCPPLAGPSDRRLTGRFEIGPAGAAGRAYLPPSRCGQTAGTNRRRRIAAPMPPKPAISIIQLPGSGTKVSESWCSPSMLKPSPARMVGRVDASCVVLTLA